MIEIINKGEIENTDLLIKRSGKIFKIYNYIILFIILCLFIYSLYISLLYNKVLADYKNLNNKFKKICILNYNVESFDIIYNCKNDLSLVYIDLLMKNNDLKKNVKVENIDKYIENLMKINNNDIKIVIKEFNKLANISSKDYNNIILSNYSNLINK